MNQKNAQALALSLITEHNLDNWVFVIDKGSESLNRLGQTRYGPKEIAVSDWVFHDLSEEVEDTVRHEVAHAICGPGCGHGLKWKMTAKTLGAVPRECCSDGIPLHLRQRMDGDNEKPSEEEAAEPSSLKYKFKALQPESYQIPVVLNKRPDGLFQATQNDLPIADNKSLPLCIAEAVAYCSERRAALVINFHQFSKQDVPV